MQNSAVLFRLPPLLAAILGLAAMTGCRIPTKKPSPVTRPFVTVEKIDGKYWFVHEGRPFLERGVSVVASQYDTRKKPDGRRYNALDAYHGNTAAWAEDTTSRLRSWNFNTVGAWSDEYLYTNTTMYHTRVIWLGPWGHGRDMRLMDVWSDTYAQEIDRTARSDIAPHAENPYLIGYFANNELPWYGLRGWPTDPRISLLTRYLHLPEGSPSKQRVIEFLKDYYESDFEAFTTEWETKAVSFEDLLRQRRITPRTALAKKAVAEWAGIVAEQYYKLVSEAIRKYDPNHLFLGSRFAQRAQVPVMVACARYADVISVNHYQRFGPLETNMVGAIAALTDKPIMITEFSYAGMENSSGCSNTHGADVRVDTQQDRADMFENYVIQAVKQPYIIGYDWFCYADISPDGRFDGEDCNYGLVDIYDRPYETLVGRMAEVNPKVEEIHAQSDQVIPAYDPDVLADYHDIKIRGIDTPLAEAHLWADGHNKISVYADHEKGAGIDIGKPGPTRTLHVKSGTGWGCGMMMGPLEPAHADGSGNVLGATRIRVALKSSKPFKFNVGLNESGHAPPGQQRYDGYGEADGEAYAHAIIDGRKGSHEYEFLLANFDINTHHGNQRGNQTIDTSGLAELGFYFVGNQGEIDLELESLRLE